MLNIKLREHKRCCLAACPPAGKVRLTSAPPAGRGAPDSGRSSSGQRMQPARSGQGPRSAPDARCLRSQSGGHRHLPHVQGPGPAGRDGGLLLNYQVLQWQPAEHGRLPDEGENKVLKQLAVCFSTLIDQAAHWLHDQSQSLAAGLFPPRQARLFQEPTRFRECILRQFLPWDRSYTYSGPRAGRNMLKWN